MTEKDALLSPGQRLFGKGHAPHRNESLTPYHSEINSEVTLHLSREFNDVNGSDKTSLDIFWRPLTGSFMNLFIGCAGAGMLSMPFAMYNMGWIFCLIATLLLAMINWAALTIVTQACDKIAVSALNNKDYLGAPSELEAVVQTGFRFSYESVVQITCGLTTYYIAHTAIIISQYGGLIGFLDVILDLAVPVVQAQWGIDCNVTVLRGAIIAPIALVVLLPLSLFEKIDNLAMVSFLAVLSILCTTSVVFYRGFEAPSTISILPQFNWQFSDIMHAIPIIIFALNCCLQIIPVHTELPRHLQPKFTRVLGLVIGACAIMYYCFALAGCIQFTSSVNGDVLLNYPTSDKLVNAAKLSMALHVVLATPVSLFPLLASMQIHQPLSWQSNTLSFRLLRNGLLIFSACVFACFLPSVEKIFSFVGGLCSATLSYTIPGFMAIKLRLLIELLPC